MTKRIIITGCFSNGYTPYFKGLSRWQIRSLNNLDRYCEYINCDLSVIDNSTPFNTIYNKIRSYGHYYPCIWAPATLCSVYGFLTTKDYDEIMWVDLDLILDKSKNIFELMKNDCHIMHNLLNRENEISFFHVKRKTDFLQKIMNLNDPYLYDTNAGLIKMTEGIRNSLENFCKDYRLDIRDDNHIKELLLKYEEIYGKQRYEFICDECIYDSFVNITKITVHPPIEIAASFDLIKQNGENVLKTKIDMAVHFFGEDKKYIPEFLKAQEEVK